MSTTRRLIGLMMFMAMHSCSVPCTPDSELGSCCQSSSDCAHDLVCLEQFPEGLCSRDCALDHLCPEGGTCIHVISQSQGDMARACLKICGDGFDPCREGYSCTKTSDPDINICFPQ